MCQATSFIETQVHLIFLYMIQKQLAGILPTLSWNVVVLENMADASL